jgi:hypothetical protein
MKTVRVSIPIRAGVETSFDGVMPEHGEGFALTIKSNCPNTAAASYTINLYDLAGDIVFSHAGILDNSVVQTHARAAAVLKDIVCIAGARINLTFNIAPNLASAVTLVFYMV